MGSKADHLLFMLYSKIEGKVLSNYKHRDMIFTYLNITDLFLKKMYIFNQTICISYEGIVLLTLQLLDVKELIEIVQ